VRKIADCREFPSESACSLTITGEQDEVVRAAAEHAASVHGHADTAELREQIRATLTDEQSRYGTVMIGRRRASLEELREASVTWARERQVPGFLREDVLAAEDNSTIAVAVSFASKEDYLRLGDDPAQDDWWRTVMAPMLDGEPSWIDGTWQLPVERTAPAPLAPSMPAQEKPAGSERPSGQLA
jgi:predicted small metal-binding protein